ncbi:MAG: hypothetical protein KDD37_04655 [Bdellovibrionales bacterium]|nr:hypothetical protein [Bdellovibrionales bacterium]
MFNSKLLLLLLIFSLFGCGNVDLVSPKAVTEPIDPIIPTYSCLEQPETQEFLPGTILWLQQMDHMKIYVNTNAFVYQYNTTYGGITEVAHDWYVDDVLVSENIDHIEIPLNEIVTCKVYRLKAVFLYCGEHYQEAIEQEARFISDASCEN